MSLAAPAIRRRLESVSPPSAPDPSTADADAPLTGAYRVLRRVAPPESPFPGWLARTDDGETVLLVVPDDVGEWPALTAAHGGHVLSPRDVVRTARGVALELDRCVERVDRFLDRREHAGVRLRAGEAVTLGVSALRAMAELSHARPRGAETWPAGHWWLTDAARPVFVHAPEGDPADAGCRSLLERVASLTDAPAVRTELAALAARPPREVDEDALFALAPSAPLTTAVFEPARARHLSVTSGHDIADEERRPRGRVARITERHIDTDVAGLVSDAVDSVRRRLRARRPRNAPAVGRPPSPRPTRRRRAGLWLVAAGVAALVVAGGVLWPTGDDGPAAADARSTRSAAPSERSAPPVTSPGPDASDAPGESSAGDSTEPEELAAIAGRLLDARRACGADDTACLAPIMEDPRVRWPPGPVDLPPTHRRVTLLDEFGGVAVVRVSAVDRAAGVHEERGAGAGEGARRDASRGNEEEAGPDAGGNGEAAAQLVVIVESDGRWLLRDVHDVAQQENR